VIAKNPDPTRRFSGRVENYVRFRPRYPAELIACLTSEAGLCASDVVADVGSGTGILSEMFLKLGNEVFGVEPNDEMREAAERILAGFPRFRSVASSAESTGLPAKSVDLVAAAQAFHWFDRNKAKEEFSRILRPPGRVVLIWNDRKTVGSPFSERYEALLREFGTDYETVDHKNIDWDALDEFFSPNPWKTFSLPNRQELDFEGLRGRFLSSSYVPAAGEARHEAMLEELSRLFEQTGSRGLVRMEYETKIHVGNLTPAGASC
jgi:SAM-dependent methyltransferase